MDAETLARLVESQAALIEEMRLEKSQNKELMKQEMLQTLRTELLTLKPPSPSSSYGEDSYGEELNEDDLQNDLQNEQSSVIVRSNSMPQHTFTESKAGNKTQLLQSTGKARSVPKNAGSVNGDSSVMTDASPFSQSANPSKPVPRQKKKRPPKKKVPLAPTSSTQSIIDSNIKLSNSTMLFLHQSAALVSSSIGKDKDVLMAETFNKPIPVSKKKKKKEVIEEKPTTSSVRFGEGVGGNTWFPGAAGSGTSAVKELKSPSKPGSRVQSRGVSTAGSTRSKKSTRPRTVGPSTVATVRSEAESLGAKLLGPLNLNGERKKAPLPITLDENEWENELARNILSLYSNQIVEEIKGRREEEGERGKRKERKLRKIRELKGKGKSDAEIEEIVRGERFSRKTRKSSMATSSTQGEGMTSAAMGVLSNLTSQDGYELPPELLEEPPNNMTAEEAVNSRGQSRKSKMSRSETRGTRVSMDSRTSLGTSGSTNNSPNKNQADKAVVAPVRPKPIWFGGTGAIQAEWGALEEFAKSKTLRKDLEALKEKGRYSVYIATVEGLLSASMRVQADIETTQLMERLWRQMVVTCNAFGVRCLEQKKYPKALELLERAQDLAGYEDIIPHHLVQELKAFVMDSFAYYYMRRNKPSAALQYITNAMKAHNKRRDWPHVAKCHLHTASILSKLERHDEAIRCLGQVLAMVDDGLLEVGSNNAQQLLLVSVAYHNIAVEQLILRHVSEACVSSQNARRLARLCLSYSNRYLPNFEATHVAALKELAASVRHKQNESESEIFQKLAKGLYS